MSGRVVDATKALEPNERLSASVLNNPERVLTILSSAFDALASAEVSVVTLSLSGPLYGPEILSFFPLALKIVMAASGSSVIVDSSSMIWPGLTED